MFGFFKREKIIQPEEPTAEKTVKLKPHAIITSTLEIGNPNPRVEVDWNDEFVEALRNRGIEGVDDNEIMRKYHGMLILYLSGDEEISDV